MKHPPKCDVCGDRRDVCAPDWDALRPGVAQWIEKLCGRCRRRFARPVRDDEEADTLAKAA